MIAQLQADIAERVVQMCLQMDGRPNDYEGDVMTSTYNIRAAVGEAIRQELQKRGFAL